MGEGDSERQTHTDMNKHNWRHPNTIKEGQRHTRHEQRTSQTRREMKIHIHTKSDREKEACETERQ